MNKNRYKLIFSQIKGCLIPVAECINSAISNGSSDSTSTSEQAEEEPPILGPYSLSSLSLLVKSRFNPISSAMQLTWKQLSIFFLTLISAPVLAEGQAAEKNKLAVIDDRDEHIKLANQTDNVRQNTKLHKTENNVIVIDIATPNNKGISDNRFEKFNIPNSAVFNNNGTEVQARSTLIGYIPHNQNLSRGKEANVILNQVTGPQESKIVGALEVLGKKADIVIANQNGITLNGVRTINSDRFVATTSELIDPNQMILKVTKGNVIIDIDGFSTDGLKYLDIIAKKIEQKQSITSGDNSEAKTDVTLIAGSSEYDLSKHELKKTSGENVSNDVIAITGSSTGAMHGKNIKLIVTDKGAGVKHDGIILSENDIQIEMNEGDLELGNTAQQTVVKKDRNIRAKKKIEVKNANRVFVGSQTKSDEISLEAKQVKIRKNAEIRSTTQAKIVAKGALSIEQNAKLVAKKIDVKTERLTNTGRIYGREVKLDTNNLINDKEIYAEYKLSILARGKDLEIIQDRYLSPLTRVKNSIRFLGSPFFSISPSMLASLNAELKPGFVNKGLIESAGSAELTFKEKTSFLTEGNNFIKAKDTLTINAQNIEIDKNQDIQLGANITLNVEENFVNRAGTLATGQTLTINAENGSIYNLGGILGAGKSLKLTAKSTEQRMGNIVNQEDGLFHTLGNMTLEAERSVYNIGGIYAGKKLTVHTHNLTNDVRLSGNVSYKSIGSSRDYDISRVAVHGWHNNVYKLNLNLQEQDKTNIKVVKMGAIRSDGDFDFKGIKAISTSPESKTQLINHGLINVKGVFNAKADQVVNQMKAFNQNALASVFKNPAKITMYYQPFTRYIWTPLSGNASREFNNLESFLDALFDSTTILKSSFYSTENFSAYQLLSHIQHSPMYQKAMVQVFGAEWHSKSYDEMRNKWKNFKENPTNFIYYPSEKAKILAGKLEGKLTSLQNGEYAHRGSFDGSIQIGKHQLSLPSVEFKAEFSDKERLEEEGVDLSSITELLEMPNLFIDNSIQLEKKKLSPIEDLDEEPRKNLDTEKKHSDSSNEALSMNDESDTDDRKWSMGNDEKEMPDDKSGMSSDERGNKPPRTDPTVDYLNPDEFFENGYLLNELLQELGEEPLLKEGEDHFKRSTNLVRLGERDRQNRESREKEGYFDLPGTLEMKLQELFEKRKQKHEAEQKARVEKALLQKTKQQEKRVEERKQEEKRQAQDNLAKQVEIAKEIQQAEEIRQKEKQLAIQLQEEENKRQEEKRLAEAKKQAEQQQKDKEKVAQEKLDIEQQKAYEEMAKREAEASKNVLLKAIDEERPKVETDPLYRTKLKYINQDDYAGANYFFNKVGLNTKGYQKVNVLGDNYFDHQVITRTIEKKVDNHLNQKYNLSDVELVKQLMDNSTTQAHELDLKLGAALTKEQQANLTQDIVWYVKTKVKGKDVFVPQVYFASETLAEAKKLQGLGTGTIRVGEAKIKAKDVVNSGTLAGRKLNVEASNKIKNQGSILSTEATRLVGRKGIENVSRSFANDELGVTVQRSQIKTEGHLHLETDKDSTIDVQASDIKAKTSFVKTGDVNLKNTHNTKHTYREKFSPSALQVLEVDVAGIKVPLLGVPSPSSYSEHTSEATSEGSTFEVDHIHFAVEKDVNQVGSKIKAKYTTGVVKGNFNTEAGKNIKHVEKEEYSSQLFTSAHASGGGTSVRYDYNSQDGGNASVDVPTNQTGVGAEAGMSFTHTKDKETVLTHTNSELQVKHGKLHVLGYADIGGVDINTKLPEDAQSKAQKEIAASKPEKAEQSAQDVAQAESNANKDKENKAPEIKELSEAEIADLMSEKSKAYFDDFAEQAKKAPENNRFELSAKEIRSNKQKDQYDREYERTTFKVGPEVEAHSAVADMVSHLVKEYRDAQNGTKQDGTVALQHASDVLNIVTGDLAGSSAKLSVERTHETKRTTETGDIVTKIGGNVTLSARSGSVNLKNVQSDEQADLTLRAKEDVNVLSGEKTRKTTETVSRQKLSHGVNAGCSMMSGACTAGVSTSLEGNESYTSERETTQNNSLLKVRNMKVEAGRDFNVVSSNIDSNKLDLHVKGKTNVVSKQDTLQKVTHGVDYNFSAGVAASSATIATPTGNIGFGYTNETETKRTVNQQAGIKANKITGQTHDVNLKGGYLVSNDNGKNLKVIGQVSSQELHDQHDKDGGSFGASVGISERGTTAFNLRGGRAEQKHYNATHKSTLSGVDTSQANVSGQVNTDLAKAKAVTRDDTYASTQFSFEVADIVELGQRAKNKLRASTQEGDTATPPALRTSAETDDVSGATTRSRGVDETDSVSVKNPIYESADAVVPTSRSRNGDSADLVDNPLYASASTKTNVHDYEDIPAVYSKVGDNNADLVRQRTAAGDEHVYAEISEPTYSRVGDNNADMRRHNVAGTTDNADVAQARTRKVDDPLPALPNQGKVRTVNDSSEHIYADIRDVGTQPKAIDSTYATVGVPKANAVDSTYATVEAPKVKTVETTYATVDMLRAKAVESEYATVAEPKRRKVRNVTDELPALPNESKVKTVNDGSEHIYADIRDVGIQTKAIDSTYATVGVPKANAVDSTYATVEAPKVNAVDSTYATVDMPRAKAVESEYATVTEPRSRKVRRATDELPANAEKKSGSAKFATEANDVNFNRKVSSAFEANDNIQIKRDDARGENYVTKNNVGTAITNTDYIPKPVTDVDAQFEKVRKKAKSTDRTKEAEKKLALIAKEAKNLPKAHLLNATDELLNGPSAENVVALIKQSQKEGKPFVKGSSIDSFEGENAKNAGKIFKNIQFDESYVETRKQINDKLVEKLEVNKEFHDLMNSKLSGNEAGIRKLFEIVESAKRESLQEVTGISGKKATLALDIESSPLSTTQGYYVDDKVHLNTKPILSFLKNKKQNNKEILDTIVHELTHHDQMQIAKNKNGNISDAIKLDAKLLDLNKDHYIDSEQSFSAYKKQPLEREAYSSGQELSDKLSKLVERGYMGGKVQNIQTIEHLPNKLNNLESPRAAQSELGDNALIYGLKYGRKELIAAANAADAEGKNAILADSYVGKLNLGFEFGQLSAFAKQVKAGKVSEQDIQELASFNDATLKNARKDDSKHRINDANVEDNQRIIRELIQNENAVDALKRIATLSDQEQEMYNALRKNEKFDMEELNESASYSAEENAAIRAYKETQTALNEARVDFFTEKTKFIAKETLERGGQLYFALDGMATDTPTFRENTKIDLNRLKEVFDPSNPFYDSVTSRELRFLYENYKDHPNLKFTIKNQVIENPLKTLEIPTAENIALSAENTPVYNKKLLPNVFKQFKRKEKSEGPKIEHLGSSPDKDSFYFPLDKIVTKDRGISKDMKVNLENIKKAFNPKDKHYNSAEAKSLRALYEQDPTMSSTRFVIGNQVIENPFKSQDLQDYIQKYHVTAPAVVKKAKPLPTLPTKATVSKESVGQQSPLAVDKKRVQSPNLKVKAEQMADPNAIYAQVNKKKTKSVDTVEGFYPESQLKTRSDKIVEQVSQAPTTEPVYADLHFRNNVKAKSKQTSSDVVYEEIAPKAKGHAPKTLEKPQKPKAHLHKGLIPESQLKTRSDKIVEQAGQAPTTEPVYADLHFRNNVKAKSKQASSDVVYGEIAPKAKGHAPKTLEKPQKPKAHLNKGLIPESQLKTRSDKIVEQTSQTPTTEPVYADLQFPVTGKTQRVISSQQETIYEEVGKKPQEEPIYQNVIRKSVNNK
ncbi:TPA: hemagglutinin repeat-containing protein [Pasteurella multocida]|uniref:two-partner secretion domain-containing protein n=1 Tax=Pasteurella multocida TaxID=747 RepID=UPI00202281D7|nr:hemagglutinin repeat-containing protein [Pasteurella multocida]MCL7813984.1 hemagglutinin repeat-containing protein [Pasteurella multocida]